MLIAKGIFERNNISVYYFENCNGKTMAKLMDMDEKGLFVEDWPNGFFDDSNDLTLELFNACLLYTSPSPRDRTRSRMPSSA